MQPCRGLGPWAGQHHCADVGCISCDCCYFCSLCNLGKVRLPSSGPGGSDRDARGPRDKNGGSGAGNPPAAAAGSDVSSRGGSKQQGGLPPAPGSLAAAAAAGGGIGGSLRSLGQQAAEKLSQAAAGAKGGSLMGGEGAPLTKGVKAHAVMLSQSTLSVNNL
jgi:hypothetical protein